MYFVTRDTGRDMDYSRTAVAQRRQDRERLLREELARLCHLLSSRSDVRQVLLFGSLAAGRCSSRSDLDLVVVLDTDRKFADRVEELQQWLRPEVEVDLLAYTPEEWHTLRQERGFLRRIAEEGEVLYEAAS